MCSRFTVVYYVGAFSIAWKVSDIIR